MKLFQQKSVIEKYDDVKSFVEAYNIGADDFILATKRIYETCFAPLNLKAHVEYKSKYGSGEPTDVMIDALLEMCIRDRACGSGILNHLEVRKSGKKRLLAYIRCATKWHIRNGSAARNISSTGSCGKCCQIECNFTGYKKYADDSGSII